MVGCFGGNSRISTLKQPLSLIYFSKLIGSKELKCYELVWFIDIYLQWLLMTQGWFSAIFLLLSTISEITPNNGSHFVRYLSNVSDFRFEELCSWREFCNWDYTDPYISSVIQCERIICTINFMLLFKIRKICRYEVNKLNSGFLAAVSKVKATKQTLLEKPVGFCL